MNMACMGYTVVGHSLDITVGPSGQRTWGKLPGIAAKHNTYMYISAL